MNPIDVVILCLVFRVVTLIIRGMLRGTIRTCDSTSCAGDCGNCGHVCSSPRIRLTAEQHEQLRALDEKGHAA